MSLWLDEDGQLSPRYKIGLAIAIFVCVVVPGFVAGLWLGLSG